MCSGERSGAPVECRREACQLWAGAGCVFNEIASRLESLGRAIQKHGLVRGMLLTARRLYRCRPGNGGLDLP